MPSRLAYAILFVSDLERSIVFYRDVIGIPFRFATGSYAEFETKGAKFALYQRGHLPELIGRGAPSTKVPWPQGEVAFFVDDPDAEHERLRNGGVEIVAPPTDRPWGERTLHVADEDGNVIELTRPKLAPAAQQRERPVLGSIRHPAHAHLPGAVGAAEHRSVGFDAVTDDRASAVLTARRQGMDRALERVERVLLASGHDLERLVVLVSADLAGRHRGPALLSRKFLAL